VEEVKKEVEHKVKHEATFEELRKLYGGGKAERERNTDMDGIFLDGLEET